MRPPSIVVFWSLIGLSYGISCPYSCTKSVSYTSKCGWLWSSHSCVQYRTEQSTCYNYCEDGTWSAWSDQRTGQCSVKCGGGTQDVYYQRTCRNPSPVYCCKLCSGESQKIEKKLCNTQTCPPIVHGSWSAWSVVASGPCSVTRGDGVQDMTYERTCTNPPPANGGQYCTGDSHKVKTNKCNQPPCHPIQRNWSDWGNWQDLDDCSALCGGGTVYQSRTRLCVNSAHFYGGNFCEGPDTQNRTIHCNQNLCGEICRQGTVTFIPNENNKKRYYQCDNGVAKLMKCPRKTVWNQQNTACVYEDD